MGGQRIAVLGDILELGEFGQELHRKVGEEVYKNKIDILITVGELSRNIADKAKELGFSKEKIYECDNKEEAINYIKEVINTNDYILVKASRSMRFEEITQSIKEEEG